LSLHLRAAAAAALLVIPVGAAAVPTSTAAAARPSLPTVSEGALPGPAVLYAEEPDVPQLANHDPRFRAPMLRVAGHEAYVDGEYLYTDHLYDDYGSDTDGGGSGSLSARVGDIEYPTDDARYAGNAADLVELRIAPGPDTVAYRFTLNTLLVPDAPMIVLAFDTDGDADTGADTLPRDPGAPFPGTDEVITTWGTGAEHSTLGDGEPVTTAVDVRTHLEANQITVTVPRSVSDPQGTWRATLAVGLHDPATGGWLRPGSEPTAAAPGGAGPLQPAPNGIFNLGFRFDEPYVESNTPPDTLQAAALRDDEPTRFAHDIDFDALAAGESSTTVSSTGPQVRMFGSRLDLGEGRDLSRFPQYKGRLQPYSLYVPTTYRPGEPVPFTLALHSLGQEHWQYNGSTGTQQIGELRSSIVATSLSRGPDGWYQRSAEYDVFEMWNDVARHLSLDPDRTAISGYSMGGYATYRLGTRYPDLFGKAFSQVAPPGDGIWVPPAPPTGGAHTNSNLWLENARNVPFLNVVASADELVPYPGPVAQNLGNEALGIRGFEQLEYRYRFVTYTPAEHFTIALLGYDVPMSTAFLGDAHVDRNPHHVTFAAVPVADEPELGLVADHAYWVSAVEVADPGTREAPGKGVVDAFSHGFGLGEPPSVLGQSGGVEPLPYTEINRDWAEPPAIEEANRIDVTLDNVAAVRIAARRAALDPARELLVTLTADRESTLRLDGTFPADSHVERDGQVLPGVVPDADGITLPVVAGDSQLRILPPGAEGTGPEEEQEAAPAQTAAPAVSAPSAPLPATGGSGAAVALLAMLGAAAVPRRDAAGRGGAGRVARDRR
jgi:hypothetical protein